MVECRNVVSPPSNASPLPTKSAMVFSPMAVLVLDASGKVLSANQESKALWQTGASELVGDFFPTLFSVDVISDDPEVLQAQWEIMLAATLDKSAVLDIQPKEGAPRPMAVRTEKAMGSGAGYIVTLTSPADAA